MRLWVFDRSGPYSSEKFDIHKEPERFVHVIAGYELMTDAELGLNTFITRDGDKYIVAQGVRICLEDKPLAWHRPIVCLVILYISLFLSIGALRCLFWSQ